LAGAEEGVVALGRIGIHYSGNRMNDERKKGKVKVDEIIGKKEKRWKDEKRCKKKESRVNFRVGESMRLTSLLLL